MGLFVTIRSLCSCAAASLGVSLVDGVCEVTVGSAEEAYALYETGRRRLADTAAPVSSRSEHSLRYYHRASQALGYPTMNLFINTDPAMLSGIHRPCRPYTQMPQCRMNPGTTPYGSASVMNQCTGRRLN